MGQTHKQGVRVVDVGMKKARGNKGSGRKLKKGARDDDVEEMSRARARVCVGGNEWSMAAVSCMLEGRCALCEISHASAPAPAHVW